MGSVIKPPLFPTLKKYKHSPLKVMLRYISRRGFFMAGNEWEETAESCHRGSARKIGSELGWRARSCQGLVGYRGECGSANWRSQVGPWLCMELSSNGDCYSRVRNLHNRLFFFYPTVLLHKTERTHLFISRCCQVFWLSVPNLYSSNQNQLTTKIRTGLLESRPVKETLGELPGNSKPVQSHSID